MRVRLLQSVLVVTTLSLAGSASAHFNLDAPKQSSDSTNGGKGGKPCGPDTMVGTPIPVTGGSMLELKVNETTPHPGHYRVALGKTRADLMLIKEPDVKNEQGTVITTGESASAVIMNPAVYPVIADNVLPHTSGGGVQMAMIPIPNINCDSCVLQVIEFMAKHGPDYFYRHCADLKITADPGKPIFDPSGGSGGGGAGGAAGSGAGGSAGSAAAGGGAGGAAGTAGSASGGAPGTSGSTTTSAGAPAGTAGTPTTTAGTGAGGSAGVTPPASAEDDGGCSVARASSDERGSLAALAGSLLLGLGWFARRRNRPE